METDDRTFPEAPLEAYRARNLGRSEPADLHVGGHANADVAPLRTRGGLFGTRVVLTFLAQDPGRTEAVILDSVYPPDVAAYVESAANMQAAFTQMFGDCERDATCRGAFPSLAASFHRVVNRAKTRPLEVTLKAQPGQPAGKIISRVDIEEKQGIPSYYLSKIMKDLVSGGLVHSHVGSKGGFSLARPACTPRARAGRPAARGTSAGGRWTSRRRRSRGSAPGCQS